MANFPGQDLKIHDPLLDAALRSMQRGSVSPVAESEDARISTISKVRPHQRGLSEVRLAERITRKKSGRDEKFAKDQSRFLNSRRHQILRANEANLFDSERRFREAIRTGGVQAALNMFGSQFNAISDVAVQNQQQLQQQNILNQDLAFNQSESELDRILNREIFQAQLRISENAARDQRKREKGGLFGNILGGIVGLFT